eukprot:359321-Chlamydomonas_euryale.AAC.2
MLLIASSSPPAVPFVGCWASTASKPPPSPPRPCRRSHIVAWCRCPRGSRLAAVAAAATATALRRRRRRRLPAAAAALAVRAARAPPCRATTRRWHPAAPAELAVQAAQVVRCRATPRCDAAPLAAVHSLWKRSARPTPLTWTPVPELAQQLQPSRHPPRLTRTPVPALAQQRPPSRQPPLGIQLVRPASKPARNVGLGPCHSQTQVRSCRCRQCCLCCVCPTPGKRLRPVALCPRRRCSLRLRSSPRRRPAAVCSCVQLYAAVCRCVQLCAAVFHCVLLCATVNMCVFALNGLSLDFSVVEWLGWRFGAWLSCCTAVCGNCLCRCTAAYAAARLLAGTAYDAT